MPQCTICNHPQRGEIEADLLQGESERTIANRYGVSKAAVGRHRRNGHLPKEVVEKAAEIAQNIGDQTVALLERRKQEILKVVEATDESILRKARDGDLSSTDAINAQRELREYLKLSVWVQNNLQQARVDLDPVEYAGWILGWMNEHHPRIARELEQAILEEYRRART